MSSKNVSIFKKLIGFIGGGMEVHLSNMGLD